MSGWHFERRLCEWERIIDLRFRERRSSRWGGERRKREIDTHSLSFPSISNTIGLVPEILALFCHLFSIFSAWKEKKTIGVPTASLYGRATGWTGRRKRGFRCAPPTVFYCVIIRVAELHADSTSTLLALCDAFPISHKSETASQDLASIGSMPWP